MSGGPVSTAELAERLDEEGLVLLDVRSTEEFAGEAVAPCDPRPGRIPGARHVGLDELFGASAEGPAAVRELVGADEGAEVIAYCHSGSRSAAAVQLLVAVRVPGAELRGLVARVVARPGAPGRDGRGGATAYALRRAASSRNASQSARPCSFQVGR